jgi:hypothetical protein
MRDSPRPTSLRVIAVLRPGESVIPGGLASNHWVVVGAPAESLERTVTRERANAIVVDMELPNIFETILRVRKVGGVAGSLPIALVGPADRASLAAEFLQKHGPGLFAPRPVALAELAARLRALYESDAQQRRASSPGVAPVLGGPLRAQTVSGPRRASPAPFSPPPSRAPTPTTSLASSVPTALAPSVPSGALYSALPSSAHPPAESALAQAASPSLRPGTLSPSALTPPSLAAPLTSLLRAAITEAGGDAASFELPPDGGDDLDDLVPPELLEPLDAPFESLADETSSESTRFHTPPGTSPGVQLRRSPLKSAGTASGVSPLAIHGDLQLAGSLPRYGVPMLLSAALRVRATGVLSVQSRGAQWQISLHAGHVLAVRGSRPDDLIGPLLARLGFLPQEAARFAEVPLDLGVRGAALLAARGYVAPDGVAPMLARAAQELLFDLFCLDSLEWEIRALENSVGIPMLTRSPDVLLVQGARARIEPVAAYSALGGDGTVVTLRAEASAIASLPLTTAERAAALAASDVNLASILRTHGELVLPALLALHWLQHLRAEGPSHDGHAPAGAPGPERTRLRTLLEAARRKDLMAVLGVSPFATRSAALMALDARRAELDALRARNPTAETLPVVLASLDDLGRMIHDPQSWERYVAALRASSLRDE